MCISRICIILHLSFWGVALSIFLLTCVLVCVHSWDAAASTKLLTSICMVLIYLAYAYMQHLSCLLEEGGGQSESRGHLMLFSVCPLPKV
jgi:hypothetical protein